MKHLHIKRPSSVILICVIILVASLIIILTMEDRSMDSSQILTLATALIGVISLGNELRRTKNIAEAEFIVNLNSNFVTNSDYRKLYDLFEQYDFETKPDIEVENSLISNYLTFFETFQLLIDRKVLRISMIDDLFAYRFFLAVHNPYVQKMKLVKSPRNFVNIYKLEKAWIAYRQKKGRSYFHEDYRLELQVDKEQYQTILNEGNFD